LTASTRTYIFEKPDEFDNVPWYTNGPEDLNLNALKASTFTILCGVAALLPTAARADLTNGSQLHISGDLVAGATTLNWSCNQPGDSACVVAPANQGDFAVTGSTGSFAEYNGTFGLITDLNNALQPLNTVFSLPNFLTFDLNNDITIELTFIPLGNDTVSADCAGLTHCTPQSNLLITPNNPAGLSAFYLDQNATGTGLLFGIFGVVHEDGGATASLSGTFSGTFDGLNPQETLVELLSGRNTTYGGNFTLTLTDTAVPEPKFTILSAAGLLGLALASSRLRRS
jgi:hypothetical protein